jgi:hypothetical protein
MLSSKVEQRVAVKFLVKLNKMPTECFRMLTEAYGADVCHVHVCLSGTKDLVTVVRMSKMMNVPDDLAHPKQMKMWKKLSKLFELTIDSVSE